MKTLILLYLLIVTPAFGKAQKSSFSEQVVAAVLVAEAGGEKSEKSMWAVAEVIHNRSVARHRSCLATVEQPWQFSCLNRTTVERLISRMSKHPRFEEALHIAEVLHRDPRRMSRLTGGSTHYATIACHADWVFEDKPLVVIGNHEFYRR